MNMIAYFAKAPQLIPDGTRHLLENAGYANWLAASLFTAFWYLIPFSMKALALPGHQGPKAMTAPMPLFAAAGNLLRHRSKKRQPEMG